MRTLFFSLSIFFISVFCKAQLPVQLASPLLKYHSVFFKTTATVELIFAQHGTQIHYTLNNAQPTEQDKMYTHPIQIKKSFTTLKAMAAGEGSLPSEIVPATFIRDGLTIQSVQQTKAHERFPGNGVNNLIDNEGGITDLHSKTWLGYQQDSVEINVVMERKQKLSSVLINFLQDQGSWIYLPGRIQVFYFDDKKQSFQLMAEQHKPISEMKNSATCHPEILITTKKIMS
jgi:hypothetical protein